jgi:hypothetical protein
MCQAGTNQLIRAATKNYREPGLPLPERGGREIIAQPCIGQEKTAQCAFCITFRRQASSRVSLISKLCYNTQQKKMPGTFFISHIKMYRYKLQRKKVPGAFLEPLGAPGIAAESPVRPRVRDRRRPYALSGKKRF